MVGFCEWFSFADGANLPKKSSFFLFRRDEEGREEIVEGFTCPKCNREFRNTTLLTRHVNDCLDRDF